MATTDAGYGTSRYGAGTFSRSPEDKPYLGYGAGSYGRKSYGQIETLIPIRVTVRTLTTKMSVQVVTETI